MKATSLTSGFKSQWMILLFFMTWSADNICTVNRRMRLVENPTKLLALTSSYRLRLSSSVTMHK